MARGRPKKNIKSTAEGQTEQAQESVYEETLEQIESETEDPILFKTRQHVFTFALPRNRYKCPFPICSLEYSLPGPLKKHLKNYRHDIIFPQKDHVLKCPFIECSETFTGLEDFDKHEEHSKSKTTRSTFESYCKVVENVIGSELEFEESTIEISDNSVQASVYNILKISDPKTEADQVFSVIKNLFPLGQVPFICDFETKSATCPLPDCNHSFKSFQAIFYHAKNYKHSLEALLRNCKVDNSVFDKTFVIQDFLYLIPGEIDFYLPIIFATESSKGNRKSQASEAVKVATMTPEIILKTGIFKNIVPLFELVKADEAHDMSNVEDLVIKIKGEADHRVINPLGSLKIQDDWISNTNSSVFSIDWHPEFPLLAVAGSNEKLKHLPLISTEIGPGFIQIWSFENDSGLAFKFQINSPFVISALEWCKEPIQGAGLLYGLDTLGNVWLIPVPTDVSGSINVLNITKVFLNNVQFTCFTLIYQSNEILLACGTFKGDVCLLKIKEDLKFDFLFMVPVHSSPVRSLTFNENKIFSSGYDCCIKVVDSEFPTRSIEQIYKFRSPAKLFCYSQFLQANVFASELDMEARSFSFNESENPASKILTSHNFTVSCGDSTNRTFISGGFDGAVVQLLKAGGNHSKRVMKRISQVSFIDGYLEIDFEQNNIVPSNHFNLYPPQVFIQSLSINNDSNLVGYCTLSGLLVIQPLRKE